MTKLLATAILGLTALTLGTAQVTSASDAARISKAFVDVKSSDPVIREGAMSDLFYVHDKSVVEPLLALPPDPSPRVRMQIARLLGKLEDPRCDAALIAALRDSDADVRLVAVSYVGIRRLPAAADALLTLVGDADPRVRHQAIVAMQWNRDSRKIKPLLALLPSADWRLSRAVVESLAEVADQSCLERLLDLQQRSYVADAAADASDIDRASLLRRELRHALAQALAQIGGERALTALIELNEREPSWWSLAALTSFNDRRANTIALEAFGKASLSGGRFLEQLGRNDFQLLLQATKHRDVSTRSAAAEALGSLKDRRAIPALIALLGDAEDQVRQSTIYALMNFKEDQTAFAALVSMLRSQINSAPKNTSTNLASGPGSLTADAAFRAVGTHLSPRDMGPLLRLFDGSCAMDLRSNSEAVAKNGLPALCFALRDPDPEIRRKATWVIGTIPGSDPLKAVIGALKDKEPSVRRTAATVLGGMKAEAAIPALEKALKDTDDNVRCHALRSLTELRAPSAVRYALEWLHDPVASVRIAAIESLPTEDVTGAIERISPLLKDKVPAVCEAAQYRLRYCYNRRSHANEETQKPRSAATIDVAGLDVPTLGKKLTDLDDAARKSAAKELATRGDASVVPALLAVIRHGDDEFHSCVIRALARIDDPRTEDYIVKEILADNSIARYAPKFLAEIHSPRAIGKLLIGMTNDYEHMRVECQRALGSFGAKAAAPLVASIEQWDAQGGAQFSKTVKGTTDSCERIAAGLSGEYIFAWNDVLESARQIAGPRVKQIIERTFQRIRQAYLLPPDNS